MATWTVAGLTDRCGFDGVLIPCGDPMLLVGSPEARKLKRCEAHAVAMGFPVDWGVIAAERDVIEAEREAAAERAKNATVPLRGGTLRIRPGGPTSFARLSESTGGLFDARAKAAGE